LFPPASNLAILSKRNLWPTSEYDPIDPQRSEQSRQLPAPPAIALAWRTVVLVAGIIALSIRSANSSAGRAPSYGLAYSHPLIFGGAHAYQGARNMALLAVFGVLFSTLAIYRRSLRSGIFAHVWHHFVAGSAPALLSSSHIF
jgi:hypothetical protein